MDTSKTWTVAEIKAANEAGGGKFFSRENMKFAGDTMRSFGVCHNTDDKGQRDGQIFLYRRIANKKYIPLSQWKFDPETGRLRLVI